MDDNPRQADGTMTEADRAAEQGLPQGSGERPATGGPPEDGPGPIVLRPAVRSMWFLFFGLLLGPAIMYFERDPDGHPAKWFALSLLSLGLILHRLGLRYIIAEGKIRARSWWGLGSEETVTLASVAEVRPMQGLVGRLVGCFHLDVRSGAADEPGLILMGQPDGWHLARRLEQLAEEARRQAAAPDRPSGDLEEPAPPEANRGSG